MTSFQMLFLHPQAHVYTTKHNNYIKINTFPPIIYIWGRADTGVCSRADTGVCSRADTGVCPYLRLPKPKLGRSTLRKAEKRGLLEAASLP